MKMRALTCSLVSTLMLTATVAHGATVTLKNDTWTGASASMALQLGVLKNEKFSAIFKPPSYPFKISKVQVYIAHEPGKGATKRKYTLEIFNDKTIAKTPGTNLYKQDINITSSTTAIGEVDVSASGISIPSGYVRVAFTQHHDNAPSIVRDKGPIVKKRALPQNLWVKAIAFRAAGRAPQPGATPPKHGEPSWSGEPSAHRHRTGSTVLGCVKGSLAFARRLRRP